jgi:hypothetical protein
MRALVAYGEELVSDSKNPDPVSPDGHDATRYVAPVFY